MNRPAVLDALEASGVQIALAGDDLRLEGPTARLDAELIARLRDEKPAIVAYLATDEAASVFPLGDMQQAYWIGRGDELGLGGVSSHVYHELEGGWDIDRLQAALARVIERHGALRTAFIDGSRQQELPADAVTLAIRRYDHRALDRDAQGRARLAIRSEMSHQVLPADRAPLLDVRVSIFADDDMVLHVSHDGLVMDGISMFIFFRDWAEAYQQPALMPAALGVGCRDQIAFDQEQRGTPAYARARDYWLERLDSLPPAPQLPIRRDPGSLSASPSVRSEVTIEAAAWASIRDHGRELGLTPTVVLGSVYAETLSMFSGGDDFTLNVTLANRMPTDPDIFQVIGNFTSPQLIPCRFGKWTTFAERTTALKAAMAEGLEHRQFSGLEVMRALAERQGAASASMPVTFNCAIGAPGDGLDGSALDRLGKEVFSISQTPQVWLNLFAMEKADALVIQFDAVEALFPAGFIDEFAAVFRRALRALTAPTAWEAQALTSLPASQCARRRAVNVTETPLPDEMLQAAFLRQAASTPEADAIVLSDRTITYRELAERAAAIAHWLRAHDVGRDELVAVLMRKGWEQIAAAFGTLMAGGAYLPIDADLPEARIRHLVENGEARVILAQSTALDRLPPACGHLPVLPIDEMTVEAGLQPPPPLAGHDPDDLAYVLFTSGSTGQPKGVMISHRSVVNLVADINRRFEVGPGDRLFGVSAFNFDLSVYDIFGALSSGAAVILPDQELALDPSHWAELGRSAGVSVWNSVPAIVQMLWDAGLPESLRLVMMSGDRIPVPLAATLRRERPAMQTVSLGGPTETTVWNILYPIDDVDPSWHTVPYGRPNGNNRYYVLDRHGRECPDWVAGGLHAAGIGLARGYWRDPERTDQAFFHHEALNERLYDTGDVGRYLPDGTIEILGRSDFQVKVNGYRIELNEIETRLVAHDGVEQAAAVVIDGGDGPRLVAFYVAGGDPATPDDLADHLALHLPDYMVPDRFVAIERLPLTGNRKVDRKALSSLTLVDPAKPQTSDEDAAELRPGIESELASIWRDILKRETVDPTASLQDLGATSLATIRIVAALRKRYGMAVSLKDVARLRTIRAIGVHLEAASEKGVVSR